MGARGAVRERSVTREEATLPHVTSGRPLLVWFSSIALSAPAYPPIFLGNRLLGGWRCFCVTQGGGGPP